MSGDKKQQQQRHQQQTASLLDQSTKADARNPHPTGDGNKEGKADGKTAVSAESLFVETTHIEKARAELASFEI
ncbi:unnamed protein product [Nippostrongylus brasiliensis]|uniref:Uncharacterized protein n=1 Tax=Nippostrongylus brasiliensis TaxID=27835 RepID=A0A0N4YVL6_NIPBR|nr:unnamed protein product [Nippostrongylus brasiliensis]